MHLALLQRSGNVLLTTIVFLLGAVGAARGAEPSGTSPALSAPPLAATRGDAGDDAKRFPRDDELWLLSTRHLECAADKAAGEFALDVQRCDAAGDWRPATLAEFLEDDGPDWPTVVYAHGNRVEQEEAFDRGQQVYDTLIADAAAPRLRFVIWSWPSDRIKGQVRDVRAKANRADAEGFYLAWFLAQLDPHTPVRLLGYSYGARITTGALHLLDGGTLGGQRLGVPPVDREPLTVALYAAAMHNYWLLPGNYHGRGWRHVERMLLINNSCDPALKRYHVVDKRNRPGALGYTGLWGLEGEPAQRLEQVDHCCEIGKTHAEAAYLAAPSVVADLRRYTLADF